MFPLERANRHLAVYDPVAEQLTHISTCFSNHHLVFAEDANRTLWTSSGGGGEGGGPGVVGWLNTRLFDATGDEQAAQGWTPLILDTNGNGQRDAYVEPNDPIDPTMDKRIAVSFYGVAVAPDGIVWGSDLPQLANAEQHMPELLGRSAAPRLPAARAGRLRSFPLQGLQARMDLVERVDAVAFGGIVVERRDIPANHQRQNRPVLVGGVPRPSELDGRAFALEQRPLQPWVRRAERLEALQHGEFVL